MNNVITSFPMSHLSAAILYVNGKDVRYYLHGVYIEAMATETRLVATDGHTAAVLRNMVDNSQPFNITIPANIAEIAIKTKATIANVECNDGKWNINGIPFVPVDGKFPDYRRIVPKHVTGDAGNYNPEFLLRVVKAGKALKLKESMVLRQNGPDDAAIAHYNGFSGFLAVIMPLRVFNAKNVDNGIPYWAAT